MSPHTSRRDRHVAALILALAGATALGGCGKTGELARPAPMFGPHRHAPVVQTPQAQDPNRPITTVDPRDRDATDDVPTAPITGTTTDPHTPPNP